MLMDRESLPLRRVESVKRRCRNTSLAHCRTSSPTPEQIPYSTVCNFRNNLNDLREHSTCWCREGPLTCIADSVLLPVHEVPVTPLDECFLCHPWRHGHSPEVSASTVFTPTEVCLGVQTPCTPSVSCTVGGHSICSAIQRPLTDEYHLHRSKFSAPGWEHLRFLNLQKFLTAKETTPVLAVNINFRPASW